MILQRACVVITAFLLVSLAGGCAGTRTEGLPPAPAPAVGAFAVPDAFAADVAEQALRQGGNAVDAAVAVAFSLAVTYPEAGNVGGGGFMLAWLDGAVYFLDYREVAPSAASRDMYLDAQGEPVAGLSLVGHRAAGVPGTVAGLWEAHQRLGRLPWPDLVAPAIALAEDGFVVPAQLESRMRDELPGLAGTRFAEHFGGLLAGRLFRQPALAAVLRRIQASGPDDFYRGETARLIEREMQRGGGLVTGEDLASYRPRWREPLQQRWRDYDVVTAPPPSSGGIAVLQLLGMKDRLADAFTGLPRNSAQYVHLTAEMEKRVFADRAEYLGDPGFHEVPVAALLSPAYLDRRAAEVDRAAISPLETVRPGLESRDTTHFSIVDRWGNAVANTYTLNTSFGSGVVVEGAGFLLNNEMDDFAIKPGEPNYYGVVGGPANEIAPGKRMLSSMTPTLLLRDGHVEMVLGSPGGSTIITTVYQTIVNVVDFGLTPRQAVGAARFHHQLLPADLVTYSPSRPLPGATRRELERLDYRVEPHDWEFGDVQLVLRAEGGWQAASDPRGRGVSRVPQ
jgi:gamma-glutamyltranspeptidase/glutathione hydrolase